MLSLKKISVSGFVVGLLVGYSCIFVNWHKIYPFDKYQQYIKTNYLEKLNCPNSKVYFVRQGFPIDNIKVAADNCKKFNYVQHYKWEYQYLVYLVNFITGFAAGYSLYLLATRKVKK